MNSVAANRTNFLILSKSCRTDDFPDFSNSFTCRWFPSLEIANFILNRQPILKVLKKIHANVMRPLFVLNFIFEPLFVHVPDIVNFLKFLLSTLVNEIC